MDRKFRVGDSVVVKERVIDSDLGFDIGGWQGRVTEISPDGKSICIGWDSITLRNMRYSVIAECEERGWDWKRIYLNVDELKSAEPRDRQADVEREVEQLQKEHAWDFLGPEGKNIGKVLAGINQEDEWAAMKTWYRHLNKVLVFPFDAKVFEHQEHGRYQSGDRMTVKNLHDVDDVVGVIVLAKRKREHHHVPLCDLEVVDTLSANHDYVQEYVVWFANR